MAYDQPGKHSTLGFAKQGLALAAEHFGAQLLPRFTLGVPFYGRVVATGEARNFYDILPLARNNRSSEVAGIYYNSQVGGRQGGM